MRKTWLPVATTIVWMMSGTAQAQVVAGWDFSQYFGDGFLSLDGGSFSDTLDANYSNFDPTGNAGAESALYGTMYINGEFGSSSVPVSSPAAQVAPTAGSLEANLLAPAPIPGLNPFDTCSVVVAEGQTFCELLSLTASAAVDVVFSADLSDEGQAPSDWTLTFGGRTNIDTNSFVQISYSEDGSSYQVVETVELTPSEADYVVPLTSEPSQTAFVRLALAPSSDTGRPVIDNVAIELPEPVSFAQAFAAVAGLAVCARRRRG